MGFVKHALSEYLGEGRVARRQVHDGRASAILILCSETTDIQAQSLPADRIKVRKRYERVVADVFALGRFENLLSELVLDFGMLS